MPPLTNPQLFPTSSSAYGYNSPARVLDKDLVAMLGGGKGIPTKGIPSFAYGAPSYKVGAGKTKPFRPGTNLSSSGGTSFGGTPPGLSGNTPVQGYNPMDNLGYESGTMGFGTPSLGDVVKDSLLTGGKLAAVGTGLGMLGLPSLGLGNLKEFGQNLGLIDKPGFFQNIADGFAGDAEKLGTMIGSAGSGLGSLINNTMSQAGPAGVISLNSAAGMSAPGVAGTGVLYDANMNPIQPSYIDGLKSFFGYGPENTADAAVKLNSAYGPQDTGFMNSVGNFFNAPRSFIPGVSGTGASATGFGGGGVPGQGITSIGNVLGTVGGLFSLADFIDDPSLASGLGTLAGAGASGIGAFSGLATAAPWLAGAALVASLLGNKKPSNKTGYTSIDLDEFKPVSFGMEGKKYSQENVDQTMQIMEPIIPAIQQLEEMYGVDLQGDLQINYGGRDGLAYNIGNRDVTGFRNRLDYFDGRDQSTRDGGSIYRKTFKGENAGKDFYKSLLGDLETIAKQKQADGGGIIDLANYRGVQRNQGVFS
jgi:hypothetical protein